MPQRPPEQCSKTHRQTTGVELTQSQFEVGQGLSTTVAKLPGSSQTVSQDFPQSMQHYLYTAFIETRTCDITEMCRFNLTSQKSAGADSVYSVYWAYTLAVVPCNNAQNLRDEHTEAPA